MNAAGRLAAFGAGLGVAFAAAYVTAAAVVPGPAVTVHQDIGAGATADHTASTEQASPASPLSADPPGLSLAQDGYLLSPVLAPDRSGDRGALNFTIADPAGAPLLNYATVHDKQLHLSVVRSDGEHFAHVHPVLDQTTGTWSMPWTWNAAGTYRVFVDFQPAPAGSANLTLTRTIEVAGDFTPEHPIAQAIATSATEELGTLATPENFANAEGKGVQGIVDGHVVVVGRQSLLADWSQHLSPELLQAKEAAEAQGKTVVAVGWDGQARGILLVADTVKPTSAQAISQMHDMGLTPVLLTGDNEAVAQQIAAEVGIDTVIAEVMPKDKVDVIARLQAESKTVAMVGDGVNDAPALAQADLGLSMGTGTDVAIEASDITLVRGDLRSAVDAIRLSRGTLSTIKTNLFWAFAYNVAAIPVAALGMLNPMLAGAAMAFSSVFVVGNSLRLRGFTSTSAVSTH